MFEPITVRDRSRYLFTKPFTRRAAETHFYDFDGISGRYRYPEMHYRQMETHFDPERISEMLCELEIPKNPATTFFGSYTGEFAAVLRRAEVENILLTDPMEEWVEQGARHGFDAHCCALEDMPSTLVEGTELFATFENYFPLSPLNFHNIFKLLSTKHGFLFCESQETRASINNNVHTPFENSFSYYAKHYGVSVLSEDSKDIRLYRFSCPPEERERMPLNYAVARMIFERCGSFDSMEDFEFRQWIAELGLNPDEAVEALERIYKTSQDWIYDHMYQDFPPNDRRKVSRGKLLVGNELIDIFFDFVGYGKS